MSGNKTADDGTFLPKTPTPPKETGDGRTSPVNSNQSSVREQVFDLKTRTKIRETRARYDCEIDTMKEEIASCQRILQQEEEFKRSLPPGQLSIGLNELRIKAVFDATNAKHQLKYCEDRISRLREKAQREVDNIKEDAYDERERQRLMAELYEEQRLDNSDEEKVKDWDRKHLNSHPKMNEYEEQNGFFHNQQQPPSFPNVYNYTQPPPIVNHAYAPPQMPPIVDNDPVSQLTTALQQAIGSRHNNVDRKLPTFSGDPSEWCNFYAAYERTTKKYKYDAAENMMRLHDVLKGNAKAAVQHLMANPLNLPRVLDTLARRFGRPEHVLDCLIEKAKSCSKTELKKPETLVEFGTAVEALVTNICSYNQSDYMNNKQLVRELITKLPPQWQENWFEWLVGAPGRRTNLEDFHGWLMPKVYAAELRVKPEGAFHDEAENKNGRGKKTGAMNAAAPPTTAQPATAADKKTRVCILCNAQNHLIDKCANFVKMTNDDKWSLVKRLGVCFCCLRKGHRTVDCRSKKTCNRDGCKRNHHPVLHNDGQNRYRSQQIAHHEDGNNPEEYDVPPPTAPRENECGIFGSAATADILPIIPVMVKGPTKTEKVYALLDTGASFSMIEADVAHRLGLQGKKEALNFTVFGGKRVENESTSVVLDVAGDFKKAPFYHMKSVHTIKKLGLPTRTFDANEMKRRYPHLSKMQAKSMRDAKPQMVIGINAGGLFAARQILEAFPGETPAAIKSLLGWYVAHDPETVEKQFQVLYGRKDDDDELHSLVKDFFSTESFGVSITCESNRSKEDKLALQQLKENTIKKDGRWETSLLWSDQKAALPESKTMAIRRLQMMEKKMDKNPEFAELCLKKFSEYFEKKYLVPREDESEREWFLPWFFAFHPSKKPRLVFDAAAKSNGKCLNDFLLKGPDLLRPLPAVLMRFRTYRIALTGDIKEMFHQVLLKEEDKPCQTILFRGMNRDTKPIEFVMPRLFFGSASSPCSAIFAKNRNAEEYEDIYPTAVKSIKNDFYMDDFLGGADEDDEAIKLRKEITDVHSNGGFSLVKWNSSSRAVLESIPPDIRACDVLHFSDKMEVQAEKTLGLYWCPKKDAFYFKLSFHRLPPDVLELRRPPTKREMVSLVMSLFDPLGFLSPIRVKALILIQHVWRSGVEWDERIPTNINEYWISWMKTLPEVDKIIVPRCLSTIKLKNARSIQMHVFVDASEEAFAAVAYLRVDIGGSFDTPFVMGKSRVAPLKGLSIPRMELQAAVMGVRLAKTIKAAFSLDVKIDKTVFWTDSKTVLCWIRSSSGRFNMFVSNRLGEILESTNVEDWRWVPTKENVADDATKMSQKVDLSSNSRWLTCVEFLHDKEEFWPNEDRKVTAKAVNTEEMEVKKSLAVAIKTDGLYLPNIDDYSCWIRLIRATAARFLAVRKFMKKAPEFITVDDMNQAKQIWIRKSQEESFPKEYQALQRGEQVDKKSRLYTFSPWLNKNGIIVMRGRLERADVDDNVKFPPLLDPKHRYTELMIDWFHRIGNHFGQERIIHALRQFVWILDSRAAVKRCWAKCLWCQAKKTNPIPPEMGQLPLGRVDIGKPAFYHTAVDYFGPYYVKMMRSTVKRWGVLFSCLTTRAVHLELAESLDASDFINSLVRFMNLRGQPAHIWSDNGSNFVRTEKELRKGLHEMKQNVIEEFLAVRNIQWHFIPPASPHMGGSWERLIGNVKRVLSAILKEQNPKESTFRTLLCEVTGILNSRPLTYVSPNPEDFDPITPNTLLNMASVVGPSFPGIYSDDDRFKKSWRYSQYLADQFWKRWSTEYLPWLAKREKWHQQQKDLKVGDLVIVLEDYSPRNQWKKGIITAVHPGADNRVRAVTVKMASVDPKDPNKKVKISELKRPALKVCPLALTSIRAPEGARREKCQRES